MAQLYFRYSTMGAGKSIEVQKVAFNYEERGQNPLVFTSSLDSRFAEEGIVASRIGLSRRAVSVNEDMNIFDLVKEYNDLFGVDAVIIDECQFLKKHHIVELTDVVDELNIPVMCYGLRADFKNELFEGSYWLLALADKIEEIKTICWCGKKALTNARIVDGKVVYTGEQIFIGGNESYIPLCRKHYKEGKVKPYKEKGEDLIIRYEKLKGKTDNQGGQANMKSIFYYDTDIGKISIAEDGGFITHVLFGKEKLDDTPVRETPFIKEAHKQIEEYLKGKRSTFDLPLAPSGTEFQHKVWNALKNIPYGETVSYKDIALAVGNEKAARAVGMANNRNPIPIIIPCHRVIGKSGKLVGYGGGIEIKEYLLKLEKDNL